MERGVSDPASRASESSRARRAGSLTPRVIVQIVRKDAARCMSTSEPIALPDLRRDRAGCGVADVRFDGMRYALERWSFSAAHRSSCSGSNSSTMHLRSDRRRDWATGMEICFGWATVTRCCSSASGLGFQC